MKKCKLEYCEKLVTPKSAKGLCPMHYCRWLKHGDYNRVDVGGVKKTIAKCAVDSCDSLKLQKGYCPKHYMKWYRHGDAEYTIEIRGKTPTVSSWSSMKQRCSNSNDPSYNYYGGRGIKYYEGWEEFKCFLKDMGERPEGTSIDRIDVNGDYTPDNCRWATNRQQSNNKTNNVYITYKGKTLTIQEWTEVFNKPRNVINWRLRHWSNLDKVFLTPVRAKVPDGEGSKYNKKKEKHLI